MSIRFLANLIEDSHTRECSHDPNYAYQQLNSDIFNSIRPANDRNWTVVIQSYIPVKSLSAPVFEDRSSAEIASPLASNTSKIRILNAD